MIVITIAFELSSNSFYFIVMDTTSICVNDVVKKMRAINELREFLRQMNGVANVTRYRRIGDFPEGRKADFSRSIYAVRELQVAGLSRK